MIRQSELRKRARDGGLTKKQISSIAKYKHRLYNAIKEYDKMLEKDRVNKQNVLREMPLNECQIPLLSGKE